MINIQFENQPVVAVGLHKVEPLWHLYLARHGNVQCCHVRIDKVAKKRKDALCHNKDRLKIREETPTSIGSTYILRKAMVDYCCLTFIFCLFLFPGLAFKANSPLLFAPWSRLLTRMKTSPVLRL